jgi:parvulin-like peptidyl-prolyl isomerase
MVRSMSARAVTAMAFPIVILVGCSGSKDDRTLPPVPATASSEVPASPTPSQPLTVSPASARPERIAPPQGGVDPQKPVATVNGRPIPAEKVYTVYQMNKEMLARRGRVLSGADDQALRAQSLEAVVADELLYQAAKAKGFKAGAAELEEALKQLKLRVGPDAAYRKFLAESGYTEESVRKEVERKVLTEAYQKSLVAGKGGVTEEQAKRFYEANVGKGMFNAPEQVHVQYILVRANDKDPESVKAEARKRVDEAAKRATAGEDFSALAKEYSQDVSASRGGDVGLIPRGVTFPEFEAVAFSTKPGEVSAVFETPKGFNVMKILEKKPESTRTYDEVKTALKLDMGRVIEQDVLKAKVQELAAGAKIELLDEAFAIPGPPPSAAATAKR